VERREQDLSSSLRSSASSSSPEEQESGKKRENKKKNNSDKELAEMMWKAMYKNELATNIEDYPAIMQIIDDQFHKIKSRVLFKFYLYKALTGLFVLELIYVESERKIIVLNAIQMFHVVYLGVIEWAQLKSEERWYLYFWDIVNLTDLAHLALHVAFFVLRIKNIGTIGIIVNNDEDFLNTRNDYELAEIINLRVIGPILLFAKAFKIMNMLRVFVSSGKLIELVFACL